MVVMRRYVSLKDILFFSTKKYNNYLTLIP